MKTTSQPKKFSEPTPAKKIRVCDCCGSEVTMYSNRWLKWLRVENEVNLHELSRRSGISVALLCLVESGKREVTPKTEQAYLLYARKETICGFI